MTDVRICGICTKAIEQDAPITLCPGCGTLYHDACYVSGLDCVAGDCSARESAPAAQEGAARAGGGGVERRAQTLERTSLPNRVKSGEFTPSGISLETNSGRATVPWERVELLTLGIIEEQFGDQQTSKSGLRSMVRKMFFGENQNEQQRVRKVRDIYLLDLFVAEQPHPYRIDGTTVNYRSFLGQVSYASSQNFRRLVTRLVRDSAQCRLDASMVAYLRNQREKIKRYGGVYDFELESWQNRDRLASLPTRDQLRIDLEASTEGPPTHDEENDHA